MNNNIDNDKFKFFSEIFENYENLNVKEETATLFVSTESWLAQLGIRNIS